MEYINIIEYDSLQYIIEADSAWNSLKSLGIVNQFAEYPYRVGIYLYTPSVGGGYPPDWKWVIFLCITNPTVNSISEITPTLQEFELSQNYPNPFNPSTKINYQIGKESLVQLKVYEVLGREVARLVDGYKTSGSYEVDFNASQLSSGIYFYKLQVYPASGAGDFVSTKKMILLR